MEQLQGFAVLGYKYIDAGQRVPGVLIVRGSRAMFVVELEEGSSGDPFEGTAAELEIVRTYIGGMHPVRSVGVADGVCSFCRSRCVGYMPRDP